MYLQGQQVCLCHREEIIYLPGYKTQIISSPFGHAIGLWIELGGDLPKFGENLVDDVLQLFQALWAHLRDIVHYHH